MCKIKLSRKSLKYWAWRQFSEWCGRITLFTLNIKLLMVRVQREGLIFKGHLYQWTYSLTRVDSHKWHFTTRNPPEQSRNTPRHGPMLRWCSPEKNISNAKNICCDVLYLSNVWCLDILMLQTTNATRMSRHTSINFFDHTNYLVAGSQRRSSGSHQVQPGQHCWFPLASQAGVQWQQCRQSGRLFFGPQIFLL